MPDACIADNVNIRLEPDRIQAIDNEAASEQRSRSQMIRILLDEALAARILRKREAGRG